MNRTLTRRGFLALGGGLLLGGAVVGTALAQQPETPWGPGWCPMGAGGGPRAGGRPGFGAGPAAGQAGPMGIAGAPHQAIAAALGMTSDELFAAMRSGKTVTQVAQEKGIDIESVTKAALEAHDTALAAQVQAGRLTQQQADAMDSHMEANIRAMLAGQGGPGMGPGTGRGMGPGTGPGRRGPGMGPGRGGPGMMPGSGPWRQGQ